MTCDEDKLQELVAITNRVAAKFNGSRENAAGNNAAGNNAPVRKRRVTP